MFREKGFRPRTSPHLAPRTWK